RDRRAYARVHGLIRNGTRHLLTARVVLEECEPTPSCWRSTGSTAIRSRRRFGRKGGRMKNNDEMQGKWEQVKGKAKQAAGDLTDNERLHDEGVGDEALGDAREGLGKAR